MHKVFSVVGSSTAKEMYLELDETQGRWPDVAGVGEGQLTMASCAIERASTFLREQWGAIRGTEESDTMGLFSKKLTLTVV